MGGRGATSHSYKTVIKSLKQEIETLNADIKRRKAWGRQMYDAEMKKSGNKILAEAARKYEYKLNGYHQLIADRTKAKKSLAVIEKTKKKGN